jgi:hypothetical protein
MARTCVLHVGTEKTGSTSIQRFLGLNRKALEDVGAYVPASLAPQAEQGFFNHLALTAVGRFDMHQLHDIDHIVGIRNVSEQPAYVAAARRRLADELAPLGSDVKVLLSNEHIHSRLRTPKRLAYLRDFLAPFFDEIVVVVYLRSQYEMARSLINTALRQGQVVRKPVPDLSTGLGYDPELPVKQSYFDLKAFLHSLAQVFDMNALRVRLYPEGRPTSELIADYCEAAGVSLSEPRQPPRENASFSRAGTLLLQKVNEVRSRGQLRAPRLDDDLTQYLGFRHPGRGLVASRAQIERFMASFAADNEMIRRAWFPGRKALFLDSGARGEDQARPLNAEEAVEMMVDFVSWLDRRQALA